MFCSPCCFLHNTNWSDDFLSFKFVWYQIFGARNFKKSFFQLFQNRTELHQQGEYKHFIRGHYKTHISYIYCYWLCLMYLCLFFCLSVNSSTTSIITYYHVFNRPFIGVFLGPSSATQGPFRCIFVQKQVEISTHSSLSVLEEFCS